MNTSITGVDSEVRQRGVPNGCEATKAAMGGWGGSGSSPPVWSVKLLTVACLKGLFLNA